MKSQEKSKCSNLTLSPCPICGCRVTTEVAIWGLFGQPNYMTIRHPENHCILSGVEGGWSYEDYDELVEAWNMRA